MRVVSQCPQCGASFAWIMNQLERSSDGGLRPEKSPDCPKCGYDVTGTNALAARNCHYFAKTNDIDGIRELVDGPKRRGEQMMHEFYVRQREWEERKQNGQFKPRLSNLFGLLNPKPPKEPRLPFVPNVNARKKGQAFNPLEVAAIYGSEEVAEFLLNNGADPNVYSDALKKAKHYKHPRIAQMIETRQNEIERREAIGVIVGCLDSLAKGKQPREG